MMNEHMTLMFPGLHVTTHHPEATKLMHSAGFSLRMKPWRISRLSEPMAIIWYCVTLGRIHVSQNQGMGETLTWRISAFYFHSFSLCWTGGQVSMEE